MTFFSPTAVSSGRPYLVASVSDVPPDRLSQFVGEVSFLIDTESGPSRISGVGVEQDGQVRFHEKDVDHDGKDVRVWSITAAEGGFRAATAG